MPSETITNMVTALRDNAPNIIEGGLALLEALVGAIEENIPLIMETGAVIIGKLVEGIATASPGVQAIIGTAVLPHILKIIDTVGKIGGVVSNVASLAGGAINTVVGIGSKFMPGIKLLFGLIAANPVVAIITGIIVTVVLATPIILGVSKPVYSEKGLAEINARSPVEYKSRTMTRYEASQKQRQLETAIRYAKDERDTCAAAGDKIGAAQARKRSTTLGREYKSFCEKAGLTPRPERTRSMTGPTVEKPKTLAKTQKNDILRSTNDGDIPVTKAAIQRVPKIRPTGWSEEHYLDSVYTRRRNCDRMETS